MKSPASKLGSRTAQNEPIKHSVASQETPFIDVLIQELRAELRKEFAAQPQPQPQPHHGPGEPRQLAHERLELWLASHLAPHQPKSFTNKYNLSTPRPSARSKGESRHTGGPQRAPAPPRPKHSLSAQDVCDLEWLRRLGADLADDFTAAELKFQARALALRLHPDRHPAADEQTRLRFSVQFAQMRESVSRLEKLFARNCL